MYKYTASPFFKVLLFGYAFDEEEVRVIDLGQGEELPREVMEGILDEEVIKTAFNAQFERVCLSKLLGVSLSPKSWRCTAVQAAGVSLPLSLEKVGKVLGLKEQKLQEGKALIRYFTMNSKGRRHMPQEAPEKWEEFKSYCIRDVEVERTIRKRLKGFEITDREQEIYCLDQEINDEGILVDLKLVGGAMDCDERHKQVNFSKAQEITGLINPNSVAQLKKWLGTKGVETASLSKEAVEKLREEASEEALEVLNLRGEMAKTSVKKYEAIKRAVCPDGRVRGLFQFYGANRTGRWAGRLVQVQNLPQNHLKDLTVARDLAKAGNLEALELLFESVPQVLSELIRTAFIPREGCKFLVADFSAIEARVIAWLAGEQWRNEVFKTHGKIYEASASRMFRVPMEEITKTSDLRQKGKIAELALGYGGSVGALTTMGAIKMGIKEEELKELVGAWRKANSNIVRFWWEIHKGAVKAVRERTSVQVGRVRFHYEGAMLFLKLPSGRRLAYVRPRLKENPFGYEVLTFEGLSATKKWERLETYGPKLVENIVQAISRDLLAEAMVRVSKAGYKISIHIHDEIVVEVPKEREALKELCELMAIEPAWAEGLCLKAEGYQCEYYKKD